ncbi:S38A4 protein, partial [Panurus biarmicus]|nr:S38A4 protein [Panurus biarmicus]
MDRMELQKVNIEPDDQSNSGESLEDNYTEPADSEKAAIRSPFASDDAESQKFLTNGYLDKKKLEDYNEEYHSGRTSFGMSSFNLSNAIMGSGILGLSYAMANTGIILFIVLLLSVAILSLYSVHLLLKISKEGGSLIYEKLGAKAFGWPGKCSVFISVTMQNIGAMSSYLFIIKYELPEVIRAFMKLEENSGEWYLNGNYLVILVTVVVILPLSLLKSLGYLGYTSGFSLTCMVFFVSVVIFKKSQIPCPLPIMDHGVENWTTTNSTVPMHLVMLSNESLGSGVNFMMDNTAGHFPNLEEPKDNPPRSGVEYEAHSDNSDKCQPKYFVFNSRTAYAIPILAFAFVCHPEVLPIYSELKEDHFKCARYCLSDLTPFCFLFIGEVEDELLHTYTKVYTFDTLLLSVRLAVLVAVTLTVPLVLFPVSNIAEIRANPYTVTESASPQALFCRCTTLLFCQMVQHSALLSVPGASSATMLIFILPGAFYLRIVKKEPLRSPQKIG